MSWKYVYNDFGFRGNWIVNFLRLLQLKKHLEANFTLAVGRSRSTWDDHLNTLDKPYIPNASYQIQKSLIYWFWSRRFERVLP